MPSTRAWRWWLMREEESEKSSCRVIYIWDVNVGEAIHIQFCQCWELTRDWPGELTPLADTGMCRKIFYKSWIFCLWQNTVATSELATLFFSVTPVILRESFLNKMELWRRNRPLCSLGSHIFCWGKYFPKYFYYLDGGQRPCPGHEKRMKEVTRSVMMMMMMMLLMR